METMDEPAATQSDRRRARRCSSRRPVPASASIRLVMPATRPAPRSTRCSPRSSCITPGGAWHDVVAQGVARLARIPDRRRRHQHRLPRRRCSRIPIFRTNRISDRFHRCATSPKLRRRRPMARQSRSIVRRRPRRQRPSAPADATSRRSCRKARCTVAAPLQGTIVTIDVKEGEIVRPGQQLAVIESMKMEHLVAAPSWRPRHESSSPATASP